ncbi:dihydroorotase [Marininema halotolerans]|uniref:Dihydroorotase n=1 Tax=Marininema halotolerans TaxID=1155944 RepID=A0A1I6PYP7_9BACL|nr:dihydroorotase family protein [Marininema halotolerans]SFS45337.1 dihydroorotase [Marininema halotolerans]
MSKHWDGLIFGGTAFLPEPLHNSYIGIKDGYITYIGDEKPNVLYEWEYNAEGLAIFPGLIDTHVHFRTPGLEHKEDYFHGTQAAAAGGVTTILDMPNTRPPLEYPQQISEKIAKVTGSSYVDFGFHFLLTNRNLPFIKDSISSKSVASVKVFMAGHETAHHTVYDEEYLTSAAEILAEKGIMLTVHAEYQPLIQGSSIPIYENRAAAVAAVQMLIRIAKKTKCAIHVLHVSTIEELQLLFKAKNENIPITYEVIHPHLAFTHNDYMKLGELLKLRPPLREKKDVEYMWKSLIKGDIQYVSSDHAPHTIKEKKSDIPPAGMPGVQELLPMVYTELFQRTKDVTRTCSLIAKLLGENPSYLFRIANKGKIALGYHADLTFFDYNKKWKLSSEVLYSKCGWSPYENMYFRGLVVKTMLRGKTIYSDGQMVGDAMGHPVNFN